MTTASPDTGLSEPAAPGPRLTRFSPGGGCACKLPRQLLDDVLTGLPATGATPSSGLRGVAAGGGPPVLRVGLDPADDAAVLELPGLEGRSLVARTRPARPDRRLGRRAAVPPHEHGGEDHR